MSLEDSLGYDKLFIIKADRNSLNTDDDEFEVSENAKKGEIQRAFKKHANSKKTNKMFATQFAKMVA
jgi:RNase P/RNase MRP subunit p30